MKTQYFIPALLGPDCLVSHRLNRRTTGCSLHGVWILDLRERIAKAIYAVLGVSYPPCVIGRRNRRVVLCSSVRCAAIAWVL